MKADGFERPRGRFFAAPWVRSAQAAAADFGRRPRLAAACPGICPAQLSQRSACFEPRRASVKLRRSVAPFPSAISLPQLSQTSTVLRAKSILLGPWGIPLSRVAVARILRSFACPANSMRAKKTEYRLLLRIQADVPGAYHA